MCHVLSQCTHSYVPSSRSYAYPFEPMAEWQVGSIMHTRIRFNCACVNVRLWQRVVCFVFPRVLICFWFCGSCLIKWADKDGLLGSHLWRCTLRLATATNDPVYSLTAPFDRFAARCAKLRGWWRNDRPVHSLHVLLILYYLIGHNFSRCLIDARWGWANVVLYGNQHPAHLCVIPKMHLWSPTLLSWAHALPFFPFSYFRSVSLLSLLRRIAFFTSTRTGAKISISLAHETKRPTCFADVRFDQIKRWVLGWTLVR